jgi:hypothetical protein
MPPKDKQSIRIQVLLTPDEMEVIQRHVEKSGESVSAFCRASLLKALGKGKP